jgi:UDP-2,3-diacylglucosamine hydrolase
MDNRKKTFFASDAHFGLNLKEDPIESEKRFVRWMDQIKPQAEALYLLGDMFDYWFEYKNVVPKGYTRFLGKIAEFTDSGIPVYMFIGNHDIWMFDYLPKEIGATIVYDPIVIEIHNKKFYLAHGDGLGDPSRSFRFLRGFFRNKICQKLYKFIHPGITVPFGYAWSRHNRRKKQDNEYVEYLGEEKEYLVQFAKRYGKENPVDFFIFGHRHIMLDLLIQHNQRVIILGDWIDHFSYAVFDGENIYLEQFFENEY